MHPMEPDAYSLLSTAHQHSNILQMAALGLRLSTVNDRTIQGLPEGTAYHFRIMICLASLDRTRYEVQSMKFSRANAMAKEGLPIAL